MHSIITFGRRFLGPAARGRPVVEDGNAGKAGLDAGSRRSKSDTVDVAQMHCETETLNSVLSQWRSLPVKCSTHHQGVSVSRVFRQSFNRTIQFKRLDGATWAAIGRVRVADGCREFKHHLDGRVSHDRPVEADADVCLDTPFVREIVRGAAVVFEVLDIGDTQLPGGVESGA